MEGLWSVFCGEFGCQAGGGLPCGLDFAFVTQPSSCINHALVICFDILIMIIFIFNIIQKKSSKSAYLPAQTQGSSLLQIISATFNGALGMVYLCLGIWLLEEKLRLSQSIFPLHWWLLVLFKGFIWLLVGLTVSLRGNHFEKGPLRVLSILASLFAAIACGLSLFAVLNEKEVSTKVALDVLSFIGASLLLLCTYKGYKFEEIEELCYTYTPLADEINGSSKTQTATVTPFSQAGFFGKMSFWWLNPIMKNGKEKTLEDKDVPELREEDRAGACYLLFMELFNKQKQADPSSQPSVLKTIVLCHWKEIFVSGFYAFLKITTLSAGPLLLNAFIEVAEGKES